MRDGAPGMMAARSPTPAGEWRGPAAVIGWPGADRAPEVVAEPDADAVAERALHAQAAGDWAEALRCWRQGRSLFPDQPIFRASELAMLQILGHLGEAEALARDGVALFPDSIDVVAQRLNIAIAREAWIDGAAQGTDLAERFAGHAYAASTLPDLRQRIAAGLDGMSHEALLAEAERADAARRWPDAVEAWGVLRARGFGGSGVWIGLGRAQRHAGRFDLADRTLTEAMRLYPDNAELAANHAEVAAGRKDWAEAARRWDGVLTAFPAMDVFWLMAAGAFREAGQYARAETLIARAIEREPDRVEARVHHAVLAERQERWGDAVARWDVAHGLLPDDPNIRNSRGDAIWQDSAARLEASGSGAAHPDSIAAAGEAMPREDADKQLALRFEGLGDHCEFGIVQRRMGAEPIGLFRFAAVSADTLTALLHERLAPLGNPDFIELRLTDGDEYLVHDTRDLYHMHSFVRRGSVDEAKFLRQQIVRLGFLKAKLIEDLESGLKMFVHKSSRTRIGDETACALHEAIEAYGPNILLVVRASEDGCPAGSVRVLRDRLLVGYLDMQYSDESMSVDMPSWRGILTEADRYRRTAGGAGPSAV